jgi:hypothetical protein
MPCLTTTPARSAYIYTVGTFHLYHLPMFYCRLWLSIAIVAVVVGIQVFKISD